ncbi:methylenetetrahydrofolate dehydrogenase (NADP+)/methenyltetrahydrofolate cyclohydrolase [Bacilli bacterium PM5-3]|nr:methylenetetrahydrofolate dehydrogenase (NADP+)/methenyltetrahydrofolate cyclohydrolase [Bacilli bacterium PM5-3]MDH6603025.1 methylenetetrahydrofolate dehydrogenase (NADP+)/methenyltetrahydrofolate cyclohydrolase [Bacilli bacterium PM5-9]
MNIVKGKDIALKITKEIDKYKSQLKNKEAKVAIVRVGDHGDDITYEKSIVKKFKEIGIDTELKTFDKMVSHDDFVTTIKNLNHDSEINGIIILRPLPDQIDADTIAQLIDHNKDIDGMSYTNIARLFTSDDFGFVPCTPQAVMEVIDYLKIDLGGLNVTIVGAGMAVGRPLSVLMLNRKATVTTCRTLTKDLVKECSNADVIVAAAGVKHLIKNEHVKNGAIVIDVGINVDNGKIYGDVDFENVVDKTKYITPVPGGIGSITTMILAKQVYKAKLIQEK